MSLTNYAYDEIITMDFAKSGVLDEEMIRKSYVLLHI